MIYFNLNKKYIMKLTYYFLLIMSCFICCNNAKTELTQITVLGTVHFPTEKIKKKKNNLSWLNFMIKNLK